MECYSFYLKYFAINTTASDQGQSQDVVALASYYIHKYTRLLSSLKYKNNSNTMSMSFEPLK